MLPNLRNTAIAATLAAAVAAAPVGPALAWGEGEQNFLAGVLATVAVGALINQSRKSQTATRAPSYASTTPSYRAPAYRSAYQPRDDRTYIPSYGTPASAAHSAFLNYSPPMRRAIQARLSDYGYYSGRIDGVWGPRTDAAVRAFAADQGVSQRLGTYSGAVSVLDSLAA